MASVHYSPQTSVIRNVTVGKTPITVNVSSVERGGDTSTHNGTNTSTQMGQQSQPPGYPLQTEGALGYPSVNPAMAAMPQFPPPMDSVLNRPMVVERGMDIGADEQAKHRSELEGIVHQTFANMALQHQSKYLRKLSANHIVLPKEDLITIIAYTVGCTPAEVRINKGFNSIGCIERREKVSMIDSIKVGIKDLYLAYNDIYNLLEDVYHLSLKYCFDPDGHKRGQAIVYC